VAELSFEDLFELEDLGDPAVRRFRVPYRSIGVTSPGRRIPFFFPR
jgi:hypothetical protein